MNISIREFAKKNKNKFNKIVIGSFLFIAIAALLMKFIDGVLLDFGYGVDKIMDAKDPHTFHREFWANSEIVMRANEEDLGAHWQKRWINPALHTIVSRHPNSFWLLTQFTWITTIVIIVFLVLKMFQYESLIPSWLKWIMSHKTLSLITMYDLVVAIGFWAGMFSSFQSAFVDGLKGFEMTITILVHAIIPIMLLIYSIIYLVLDQKVYALKKTLVIKGMIFPFIYSWYYVLVSVIWNDPYGFTDMNHDFVGHIWKLPVGLIAIFSLLWIMLLIHNWALFKFNKKYNYKEDKNLTKKQVNKLKNRNSN